MVDGYNKRPKRHQTKLPQKRKTSNTAVPEDSNATTISHRQSTNKEIKESNQHYKVTSLDSRRMFNRSTLLSQILSGYMDTCVSLMIESTLIN